MKAAALTVAVLALTSSDALAHPRRAAIVVGNNAGMSDELELRFAQTDAEKIKKVLEDLGGFEPEEIHLVLGRGADELEAVLDGLKPAGDDTGPELLFFYFSGHSDGEKLHLSGTSVSMSSLAASLDATKAQISIAVVDACKSGAFTRAKGARQGPAFEIDLLRPTEIEGQIVITSSSEDEISQESDKLEGSLFTHHWVSGLYGAADRDRDGLITLEEAYRYARFRTIEHSSQSRGGVQHPSYRLALLGNGNVVLSNLNENTAELRLGPSRTSGEYFVLDDEKQLILTEIEPERDGRSSSLRLPPGKYRVRKRERDRFLVADVEATPGAKIEIYEDQMRSVPYTERGGLKLGAATVFEHGPYLALGIRSGLVEGMSPGVGFGLGYELGFDWVRIGPRFFYREASLRSLRQYELDFGLRMGAVVLEDDAVEFALKLDAGVISFGKRNLPLLITLQEGRNADPVTGTADVGFSTSAIAELSYSLGSGFGTFLAFDTGAVFFEQSDQRKSELTIGVNTGLSYEF